MVLKVLAVSLPQGKAGGRTARKREPPLSSTKYLASLFYRPWELHPIWQGTGVISVPPSFFKEVGGARWSSDRAGLLIGH